MRTPAECIRYLEAEDCLPDAGNGVLNIKNGSRLPGAVVDEIKQQKDAILTLLEYDRQAQAAGLNVGLHGELYWLTLPPTASLYMEHTGGAEGEWSLYRENDRAMYQKHHLKAAGSFDDVLAQAANYIEFLKRKQVV